MNKNNGVISKTEALWRHLLVRAGEGQRRFPSLSSIAGEMELGTSTVHEALRRPVTIGAVIVQGGGGVRIIDPWRLMLLWAGRRDLSRDVLAVHWTGLSAAEAERRLAEGPFILGGFGAVVSHEGGNRLASYDRVLCYGRPDDLPSWEPRPPKRQRLHGSLSGALGTSSDPQRRGPPDLEGMAGGEGQTSVTVLEADPWLSRYGRITPVGQAYVDLFNTPGWPAERFVHELTRLMLAG